MKARVITVTVVAEAFSVDSIPAMLHEVARQIASEVVDGHMRHDDGDEVAWSTVVGNIVRVEVQP